MTKPISIKIILGLTYLKLSLGVFILLAFGLSLNYDSPITRGIVDGCCEVFNLDNSNVKYAFGKLTGIFFIPTINAILQIVTIFKRKRNFLIALLILELLIVISRHSFPLFAIVSLILLFAKSSKEYFLATNSFNNELDEIGKGQ